jgi:hypothetical protein
MRRANSSTSILLPLQILDINVHQRQGTLLTDLELPPEEIAPGDNIAVWLAEGTPDSAARLDDLARSTDNKETRKAARRALYALSQRGIVPPPERAPDPEAAPDTVRKETARTWASAFDGAGNRLVIVWLPGVNGGLATTVQLLGNDELGLRNLTMERRRPRDIPPLMERLEGRIDEGLVVAEIEPDYARWLIDRFREINFRRSTTTPEGFLNLLPRIGAPLRSYETSPIHEHISAGEVDTSADLPRDPVDLFRLPWFDPWFFAVEEVAPWLERWMEASNSVVVFAEKAKEERKRRIAKEATAALIPDDVRARYAARLEESGDVLRRRGRTLEARQALFHALAVKTDAPIGEVPFAEALTTRTLEAAAEMVAAARQKKELDGNPQENT